MVLDTVGGDMQVRSSDVLRAGGILATTVSPQDEVMVKAHNTRAAFVFDTSDATRLATAANEVAVRVRVLTDCVVSLANALDAFANLASGRARGKIIPCIAGW